MKALREAGTREKTVEENLGGFMQKYRIVHIS